MNLTEDCCPSKDEDGNQCWRKTGHYGPHLVGVEVKHGVWEWKTWANAEGER